MRYYKLRDDRGKLHLAVEVEPNILADLTSVDPELNDVGILALTASLSNSTIDVLTKIMLESAMPNRYSLSQIVQDSKNGNGKLLLSRPFDPPEIWAAGVTYKSSEMERRRESSTPDVYSKVYMAERPELFLKATAPRCAGPFEPVGIRGDSIWNVPEPELALLLYKGAIIGYTVGNDMSSRSIEGENPLYLPQAKIYERSCAIGPCLATTDSIKDNRRLDIRATVSREGTIVFRGETNTSEMARTCEELASWLQRHNPVPDMTTLLTGTPIVPPPDFTLHKNDVVTITIDNIGTLENNVVAV